MSTGNVTYKIHCHECGSGFDAVRASWCGCLSKERTLLCPQCGKCFCKSTPGYRLDFWFHAPASFSVSRAVAVEFTPIPTERPAVMVVDDDEEIRWVAQSVLTRMGLASIAVSGSEEALTLLTTTKPYVVLTDALMPGMDGRELCRRIKSDPANDGVKVIVMSALYTSPRYKHEAIRDFQADGYLAKPIEFAELEKELWEFVPARVMEEAC